MNNMSFAPLLNHAFWDNIDSLSIAVSAVFLIYIQEEQILSMNNTSTLSSIVVFSADSTRDVIWDFIWAIEIDVVKRKTQSLCVWFGEI